MTNNIKKTITAYLFVVLLAGSLFVVAQEENYQVSLVDAEYEYIRSEDQNVGVVEYYKIIVRLENTGTDESVDYTVEMKERNFITKRNDTILSDETKMFIFEEYPIRESQSHSINISFFPTNQNLRNSQNSGQTTLILSTGKSDDSNQIPGYGSVIFLLCLLIIFASIKKRKK